MPYQLKHPRKVWPPQLTDAQTEFLISNITDWQITHGSMLKLVISYPVGTTLFPTLFPQELFDHAVVLQPIYNKLYVAVANDVDWLYETLKDLIAIDRLASALWTVHKELEQRDRVQELTLGIFRSDYMLHLDKSSPYGYNTPTLKQVEFNTISCAGGIHSDRISDMHRHLHRIGAYQDLRLYKIEAYPEWKFVQQKTVETITAGLREACSAYVPAHHDVCVLMVVQPNNFNIADERPIEYALWDVGVPTFRIEWGPDIFKYTNQTQTRELIYWPSAQHQPMEVAVVYFRAGYEAKEYGEDGIKIRLHLESSKAIMCPSVLTHLTTFKKVQQALAQHETLERYLEPSEAKLIRQTFAPMYPLDDTDEGENGKKLALDLGTAKDYVLKPSLEGGGHNVYGENIPQFLADEILPDNWKTYILQEKIKPPVLNNSLMSYSGLYTGSVISELGIFGGCIWRRCSGERQEPIFKNLESSCSFKTKNANVDEMSVVKGYGCFDSPALVDMETFMSCLKE